MKSDKNGCSTCKPGQDQYEKFYSRMMKKYIYHYDWRHPDGELFSCTGKSLEACWEKRDKWLETKKERK